MTRIPPDVQCPARLALRGFVFRAETDADLPALRQVYVASRWAEFAPAPLDNAQKTLLLNMQFDAQRGQYRAAYPAARFNILANETGVVGRLYWGVDAEGVRLIDILIRAEARGQGLGASLIAALLAVCAGQGLGVSLHVDKTSPARALYERLGFCVTQDAGLPWRMDARG